MTRTPRRRLLAATLTVASLLGLGTGCADDEGGRSGGEGKTLANKIGQSVTSSSGDYRATLAENPDDEGTVPTAIPTVTDRSGKVVYRLTPAYSTRPAVALVWQRSRDVLWVLSADVGNSKLAREGGRWTKQPGTDPPPEIEKWLS